MLIDQKSKSIQHTTKIKSDWSKKSIHNQNKPNTTLIDQNKSIKSQWQSKVDWSNQINQTTNNSQLIDHQINRSNQHKNQSWLIITCHYGACALSSLCIMKHVILKLMKHVIMEPWSLCLFKDKYTFKSTIKLYRSITKLIYDQELWSLCLFKASPYQTTTELTKLIFYRTYQAWILSSIVKLTRSISYCLFNAWTYLFTQSIMELWLMSINMTLFTAQYDTLIRSSL